MIKLNAGFSRKVGESNYGSRGASVNVELELESGLVGQPDALLARIRQLFTLAREAVDAELNGPAEPNAQAAPAARRNGEVQPRQATASQVRAIRSIAERQKIDADRLASQKHGVSTVEQLTLQQASSLIDELKAAAAPARKGVRG